MNNNIRVRFAPSPTGPLHIGGVRTALYNYLFAKKHQGTFLLRIEDTDQKRFVKGAEEYIAKSLEWCGIKVDEGVAQGGNHAPYRQSERKAIYQKYIQKLIDERKAYYAFDTPEALDEMRKKLEANKSNNTSYHTAIRHEMENSFSLSEEEVKKRIEQGNPYVIRFNMPENRVVDTHDIIRGKVSVNTSTLDDKVLFKSDGLPTYHFANIVDDHLMEISHVIRGEEWLPSLPLHILLYEALDWEAPEFAHLPLLLKPSGKGKLSKRDGDKLGFPVFPLEWTDPKTNEISMGYREQGYFAEAFINMLALLGWNPGTEQEIFSMDELIDAFSLERVSKSGARFDVQKAQNINQHYLREQSNQALASAFDKLLKEKGIEADLSKTEKIVGLVKERAVFIADLWEQANFFYQAPETYDAKTVKKRWKAQTPELMKQLIEVLQAVPSFTSQDTETAVKSWIEKEELGMGAVMNAFRLAVVGAPKGPHMFDIIEILGKDETLTRLQTAIEELKI